MDKITCPQCAHTFNMENALANKIEAQYKAEAERKIAEQAQIFHAEKQKLDAEKSTFEQKKAQENRLFNERLEKKLAEQKELANKELTEKKQLIEKETQRSFAEQYELQLQSLKADNDKKIAENKALKIKELDFIKKEQELKEKAEELDLQMQKKLFEETQIIEEKVRNKEREVNLLREKEYQKQLEDQKKLIDAMQRKAEQGSMQLQGEVQEVALEELLIQTYPFDKVEEVAKGVRGADCIHTVVNNIQQACGSIVYESKRTKNFNAEWITKLKQDQTNCKADLAVLVTATLPSDMERFGFKDGVWICGFHEVKGVSMALRQQIISIHTVKSTEENKGDKMELVYNYLTGSVFAQNISRIVENYDVMHNQLRRERRAMEKIWKERESQILVMEGSISSMFGAIKGIAGNELQNIPSLELTFEDD